MTIKYKGYCHSYELQPGIQQENKLPSKFVIFQIILHFSTNWLPDREEILKGLELAFQRYRIQILRQEKKFLVRPIIRWVENSECCTQRRERHFFC